jgi:hypothetical protein
MFQIDGDPVARLVNFLLYQVGWFCCVLGAAWHLPWVGTFVALCLIGVHLWLTTARVAQLVLVLVAAAIGLIVDSVQLWAGVFAFSQGVVVEWLPPPWMSVLWIQFATTFQYSMRWLSGRYTMSACFGLAGAPLAFFAGERLGAIEFLSPRLTHYCVLALLWSVAVPLLIYLSDLLAALRPTDVTYRWIASPGQIFKGSRHVAYPAADFCMNVQQSHPEHRTDPESRLG